MIVIRCAIVAWIAVGLIATRDRVALWAHGERALWADAVAQAPDKPRPWLNLGRQYALDGHTDLAADAYRRAFEAASRPNRLQDEHVIGRGLAAVNLALLRCAAGDVAGALAITDPLLGERPIATQLVEVQTWLEQQQAHGGCSSAPSSF